MSTVLPRVFPCHILLKASRARSMGITSPISGFIPARMMKAIMRFISRSVPMIEPHSVIWSPSIGSSASFTSGPVVSPVMTMVPPRATEAIECSHDAGADIVDHSLDFTRK